MRKTLKVFAVISGIFILLLAVVVGILPFVIDPNQFKPRIAGMIQQKIGREVVFDGDLHLSVFPSLGISSERIRIKNVPGFQAADFLGIEQGEVRVSVWPLLDKRLEINRIDLKGLRLNLIRTQEGLDNWSDLFRKSGAKAIPPASGIPPPSLQRTPEKEGLQLFEIGGISLKDTKITWDDRQAGKRLDVDNINLDLGPFHWERFTDVALQFSVIKPESGYQDRFDLKTRAMSRQDFARANFADTELKWTREGKALPGKTLTAMVAAPEILFENDAQKIQVPKLQMQSGKLSIASSLTAVNLFSEADVDARIDIAEFNPAELMQRFEIAAPKFQDSSVFSRLQAGFNLQAVKNTLSISALRCKLDDTLLQGDARIEGREAPSIRFNLAGDAVDIGRYLPPSAKNKNKLVSPSAAIAVALSKLPVERLRKLDAQGELHLQHLKMSGITADDLHLKLNAKDGAVQTRQEISRFYRGGYSGSVDFNAKGSGTTMALTEKVEHVDIEAILKVIGSKIAMSGVLTGSAALRGQGNDPKQIRQGLKGNLAFGVKDGSIRDVKFLKIINQGIDLLNKVPLTADAGSGLGFSEISGTGILAESVIRSEDLLVKSPRFRITGSGLTHVDTGAVDYRFVANLVKAQATATEPEKFHSTPVVVNMNGTLTDPGYRLDTAALLTEKNKAKIDKLLDKNKDKIDKLKEKLDKKLGPGVGDLLDKLF
ncbi:MAG: AsmA family protein [Methylomicrobium sp.]